MTKRISSLPLLVLVAVVALVLGSFGTAVAGPAITKGKVKGIATKVVNKLAPTLSVAHATTANTATSATSATSATTATTAGNATQLNGQSAPAYQNPAVRFALPVQAATATRSYSLTGIAPGTYIASYDVFMQTAGASTESDCAFYASPTSTTALGWTYGQSHAIYNSQSATTLVTVGATPPRLYCEASASWSIYDPAAGISSSVVLTKVDAAAAGTTTGAKSSGSRPGVGLAD
jgi:hypothetical protein